MTTTRMMMTRLVVMMTSRARLTGQGAFGMPALAAKVTQESESCVRPEPAGPVETAHATCGDEAAPIVHRQTARQLSCMDALEQVAI